MLGRRGFVLVGLGVALLAAPAHATVPPGFEETLVTGGLTNPTAMALAPDGRIFVAQQGGALRVIKNGVLQSTAFVNLTVDANGERGLLGVAFDPNFNAAAPGDDYVYVYYTVPGVPPPNSPPPHNRVSRFTASGDVAVPGSELPILDLEGLSLATNHNGGAIHFGPDGKLYVATGENANPANSQTLANRLGKILRINADGSIPLDNPYPEASGANKAIWAIGLRNPFTFAFQPGSGRMFVNDVGSGGADAWEEINDGIARSNYGWPDSEGPTTNPLFRSPLYAYRHGDHPGTCAITGGAFYNPSTVQFPPAYVGDYFFSDLCAGWIRRFDPGSGAVDGFASGISFPVDLLVADDGSLLYLARGSGSVYRVTAPPTAAAVHSLTARRVPTGVLLRWRSSAGIDVLGFHVYRERAGRTSRVNRKLIAHTMRDAYSFLARGTAGARYRVEVVFADGHRVAYGPVAST